jgi:spore coat polysaccharide biosynthesis protein SpsF
MRAEDFWKGEFGDRYTERNSFDPANMQGRIRLWSDILRCFDGAPPASLAEVGSNIGLNLAALARLTSAERFAIEPNDRARQILLANQVVEPDHALAGLAQSIPLADGAVDLSFTSGVLIHVPPADLAAACTEIHRISRRYIVCIEYFADRPEEVRYHEQQGLLFKRDFGSFWLDQFPSLVLRGYGFAWRRVTGLDNVTWWAFEKPAA